jgi:predicted Zn finger-like uncharacterized protein
MAQIAVCPSCKRKLLVPDELQGKSVRCPTCETVFTAASDADVASVPPPTAVEPSGLERIHADEEPLARERHDREPSRPRREDEDDDYYDGPEYAIHGRGSHRAALAAVSAPATALQVVSGILVAINIIFLFLRMVGIALPLAAGGAGPIDQRDRLMMVVQGTAGVGSSVLGLVLSILIAVGATKMKRLESRGWAMASSIIAIIPCTGCCVLSIPFGIWALVVLNKPEVRDNFR